MSATASDVVEQDPVERDPVERDPVARLYDEWAEYQGRRLDAMPCELHIHCHALAEHLPAGSRVLDVGAGPGRYALELLRAGHRLVVGDLSTVQVEAARRALDEAGFRAGESRLEAVLRLDARDLGAFADASFDAVVAFGPFYHLQDAAERDRALAEASRVLRPGGLVFATFMPRAYWTSLALHHFVTGDATGDPAAATRLGRLERLLDEGIFEGVRSPQLRHGWFCRVEEIAPTFARQGIEAIQLLASSGITAPWSAPGVWRRLDERPPEIRDRFLELVRQSAADPHVLALSDQVLFVGRKRSTDQETSS